MLDLEEIVRSSLYVFSDVMPMQWPKNEGPQDEHVERVLEQFDSVCLTFAH